MTLQSSESWQWRPHTWHPGQGAGRGRFRSRPACQVPHSGQEEGGRGLHKGALCGWGYGRVGYAVLY